jgi:hypothetical protein
MTNIRIPVEGERILVPVDIRGRVDWLPAIVTSPPEYGPAGHCPGYFCFNLAGTVTGIGGAAQIGYDEYCGEGVAWRFEDGAVPLLPLPTRGEEASL